ncbi:EF-hand and coiled-coil domain-containing protein 1-like [Acanthaster planci]|uniref:EF-hand and coiled-coil domain-containing protein 1-like n=1 Tax=Acanthaster planci TaxID=133434 RepID=A0A8B7ZUG4_ACAPL|nr:EF-hand and coiled-coil domain-containing protein 1-like [Acanthaster planci]
MERPESFIVPARRSQWLVSALAYAFGLDQGIENEVVVLATGIDQYIQEIFHHLDLLGKDRVSISDFQLLCEVIGCPDCGRSPAAEEPGGIAELTFKEFHSRLVQCFIEEETEDYFSRRWDSQGKFVEAEVRVLPRSGLSIRTMCTECFQKRPVTEIYHSVMFKQGKPCTPGDDTSEAVTPTLNGTPLEGLNSSGTSDSAECRCTRQEISTRNQREVMKLQQENDGLREIIEDMRQALQSSDARHLALLVSLRKMQMAMKDDHQVFPPLPPKLPGHSFIRPQNAVTLSRELSRLRDDRDRQLEEAIRYTQSLEADLWQSRRDQVHLGQARSLLLGQRQSLAQRLCSTRETLSRGLERVRELEKQIEGMEDVQTKAKQLAEWKQRHSEEPMPKEKPSTKCSGDSGGASEASGISTSEESGGSSEESGGSSEDSGGDPLAGMDSGCASDSDRGSPTSAGSEADSSSLGSGSISDEESAWQEEANNNNNNNTNNNNTDGNCANSTLTGGLNDADWLIKLTQVQKHLLETEVEKGQAEGKFKQIRADLLHELNTKLQENEQYKTEIQSLETERVRLSVIESTVGEVITLLRKLRSLNLSRRSAGKILMDTLEVCLQDNCRSDSENEVRNFLNFLHKQLMHHDLLRFSGPRSGLRGTQSTPNSPLMQRRSSASAAVSSPAGRSSRLSTDFYQLDSTAKKVCRGAPSTSSASTEDVEGMMMCNGYAESPTLDV